MLKSKALLILFTLVIIPFIIMNTLTAENKAINEKPVTEWLMVGPYPIHERSLVLSWPFLPEKDLAPSPDETIGGFSWKKVDATGFLIDLFQVGFPTVNYHAAYAFTYIHAQEESRAKLLLGSDDGIAVWLNGREVWRNDIQRGHTARADQAEVTLNQGWNRLLLKISQFEGGWQFSCIVESPTEIKFSLNNPYPQQWTGPETYDTDLIISEISTEWIEKAASISVAVAIYNLSTETRENITVEIQDSGGNKATLGKVTRIMPFSFTQEKFLLEAHSLAQFLQDKHARVTLRYDDKVIQEKIPEKIFVQALALISANLDKSEPLLTAKAQELQSGFNIYDIDPSPFTTLARTGLQAVVAQDKAALQENIQAIIDQSFTTVPDKTDYNAHVLGHAHIDMNWLWTYSETLKSAHDSFRQVIAFMDEFPDFTFIQSQTALYAAIEKYDPGLFEQIKKYVKQGRWEIAGGMRVEGDTNLSSGESLVRSFLLGQRYFLNRFGKIARVGWLPDNFGHTAQLPQILQLAGCDYYYFHRCRPYFGTFYWQGPDGSTVLCYSNETYNGRIRKDLIQEFDRIVPEKHRLLNVCGVGDHGGGPTRTDIEMVHLLDQTPRHPAVKFTTAENFFENSIKEMAGRPTHKGEMQFVFEGCYTSVAQIKAGNRRCEAALFGAELLSSVQFMRGQPYPADELRKAWDIVTFNTFHDILPGSAIHESNQDAIADYKTALSTAESVRGMALRSLADAIAIDNRAGQSFVVFNPQPRVRTAVVEAEVYSHDKPATASLTSWFDFYGSQNVSPVAQAESAVPSILVKDASGKGIPAQIVWGKNFPPGWRFRIQFIAEDLPAGGYRTYFVDPAKPGVDNTMIRENNGEFSTDFFNISVDMNTGEIRQIFDKRLKKNFIPDNCALNQLRIYQEAHNNMSAWTIGKIVAVDTVDQVERVSITERGPVRACIEAVKHYGRSKFIQRTYIYRAYPRIDFDLEVHWFEQGTPETGVPLLRAVFPVAIPEARFTCHVPFAAVERPVNGQEVPAQKWIDISDGEMGIALLNNTKYGHSFQDGELRLSLLRSSYHPDIYPNLGLFHIRYALFPHDGDWKNGVWAEGEDFNVPVMATEPPSFALDKPQARLPLEYSFITIEPSEIVLTGVKQSEAGQQLILRLVEVEGKETATKLVLSQKIKAVEKLDLLERPLKKGNPPRINQNTVEIKLAPYEIVTFGVTL